MRWESSIKYYYDLHIHSILSPCADLLMTPNNILNMAMLKELDFLAITDHNSTKQLKIIQELQESYDFIIIPGVEVSVLEEFDVLCYFRSFEDAISFNTYLEAHLTDNWNNYTEDDQIITDIYDMTLEVYSKPLTGTTIPYGELVNEVRKYDGAIVLAHIDRKSQTPLKAFKLSDIEFDGIEIQPYLREQFIEQNEYVKEYKIFHNSDSHSLLQLHEKEYSLELKDKTIDSFFEYLKGE